MEARPSSARRPLLAAVVLLLVVGLSACGGEGPVGRRPAAIVAGHRISLADLEARVQLDKEQAVAQAEQQGVTDVSETVAKFVGRNDHAIPMSAVSTAMTRLITDRFLDDLLAERGGAVTAADREGARQALQSQLQQQAQQTGQPAPDLSSLPKVVVDDEVEQRAMFGALRRTVKVDEADVKQLFDQVRDQNVTVCIRALAAGNQQDAEAARQRLLDGEDFATVFADVNREASLAQRQGEAGCGPVQQVAQTFGAGVATAAKGDVLEPMPYPDGVLVAVVTDRKEPTLADARESITAELQDQRLKDVITKALAAMEVDVDPRYGTWSRTQVAVIPPTDPLATTTTAAPLGS